MVVLHRLPVPTKCGQALSLRDYLVGKGACVTYVEPVVVLPGWGGSYLKNADIRISDTRNIAAYVRGFGVKLTPEQISRIATEMDVLCHELELETKNR